MVTRDWTNLDVQGRRMNKTVKLCETMIGNLLKEKEKDHDLIMAYIDRMVKCSNHQSQLTDMVMNLKMLTKLAQKKYLDVIVDEKLKELT